MIPLPEPDGVMGSVWALVRSAPNFDGRDGDVVAAVRAYATRYAAAVRAEERERCARVCDEVAKSSLSDPSDCYASAIAAAEACAAAIRSAPKD